jgi:hypothetical protein
LPVSDVLFQPLGGQFPSLSQGFFVSGHLWSFVKEFHCGPAAPPMIAQNTGK